MTDCVVVATIGADYLPPDERVNYQGARTIRGTRERRGAHATHVYYP
jgi:hypothetical protein